MADLLKQHPNDANARALVEGIAEALTREVRIRSSLDESPKVNRVQADDVPGFFATTDGGYSIKWVMSVRDLLDESDTVALERLPSRVTESVNASRRNSLEFAVRDVLDELRDELEDQDVDVDAAMELSYEDPEKALELIGPCHADDGYDGTREVYSIVDRKVDEYDMNDLIQFEVRLVHHKGDPEGEVHVVVMANDDSPYFRDNGDFFGQTGVRHINPAAKGPEMILFRHDVMLLDDLTEEVAEEVIDRFRTTLLHPSDTHEDVKSSHPTP